MAKRKPKPKKKTSLHIWLDLNLWSKSFNILSINYLSSLSQVRFVILVAVLNDIIANLHPNSEGPSTPNILLKTLHWVRIVQTL